MTAQPPNRWPLLVPFSVLILLVLSSLACVGVTDKAKGFELRRIFTLKSGQQRSGDQVFVAYKIRLEKDTAIGGNLTMIGRTITLDSTVQGDVVVVADRLTLGEDTQVNGDLVVCVKHLDEGTGTQIIGGKLKKECTTSNRVSFSNLVESAWNSWQGSLLFRVSASLVGALLFGALSALFTAVFPRPLVRMSESVYRSPFTTGGIGCLTMLVAAGLTVTYAVSLRLLLPLILLPVVMLGWLAAIVLSLIGWVALAGPFGIYLLHLLGMGKQPRMIGAAVGGIALALLLRVWSVFWFTAWIGLLATVVLGSFGLGAVLLTRVGTRPYPHPTSTGTAAD